MPKTQYTDEQRQEALSSYEVDGPAAAERATGIPRKTISTLASRSGVKTDSPTKERTEAARTKRLYDHEQFKTRMTELLAEVAETAIAEELRNLAEWRGQLEKVVGARPEPFTIYSYSVARQLVAVK